MKMRVEADRLHSLYRTNFPLEAERLADLLIAHGVPAMSRWTAMPPDSFRFAAPDLTVSEVCIYRGDLDRALEIIRENREEAAQIVAPMCQPSSRPGWTVSLLELTLLPVVAMLLAVFELVLFAYLVLRWLWRYPSVAGVSLVLVLLLPFIMAGMLLERIGYGIRRLLGLPRTAQ